MGFNLGSTEGQIIATMAGVILAGTAAFLGHYGPIWIGQLRRWFGDRKTLLHDNDSAMATLDAVIKERDELRAALTAASQGSGINRGLIDALQSQIDEMRTTFSTKLAEAVQYSVELTIHIMDGDYSRPLPEAPESISDEVRAKLNARLERRKEPR